MAKEKKKNKILGYIWKKNKIVEKSLKNCGKQSEFYKNITKNDLKKLHNA